MRLNQEKIVGLNCVAYMNPTFFVNFIKKIRLLFSGTSSKQVFILSYYILDALTLKNT